MQPTGTKGTQDWPQLDGKGDLLIMQEIKIIRNTSFIQTPSLFYNLWKKQNLLIHSLSSF